VICFSCFLAGHHGTHRVREGYSRNGNCDCGDEQIWEPSGFCPHHRRASTNPDQDELTHDERHKFRAICRVMIEQLPFTVRYHQVSFSLLCRELVSLVGIGDAVRRCCALAFDGFDLCAFLLGDCDHLLVNRTADLLGLLGALINDNFFRLDFGHQILPHDPEIVQRDIRLGSTAEEQGLETTQAAFRKISSFLFHEFRNSSESG
jgi:hypothetical protein